MISLRKGVNHWATHLGVSIEKPVQIASLGATVGDIVDLATLAAFDIDQVHGAWSA